jgi:hypothetical protein
VYAAERGMCKEAVLACFNAGLRLQKDERTALSQIAMAASLCSTKVISLNQLALPRSVVTRLKMPYKRPCHGSGRYSPASHPGGPGSLSGQSMWGFWWTKWHLDWVFSEFFGFPLSITFNCCFPSSYITWGMNSRPVGGRSS